jgi:hypothetical protein
MICFCISDVLSFSSSHARSRNRHFLQKCLSDERDDNLKIRFPMKSLNTEQVQAVKGWLPRKNIVCPGRISVERCPLRCVESLRSSNNCEYGGTTL